MVEDVEYFFFCVRWCWIGRYLLGQSFINRYSTYGRRLTNLHEVK